MFCSNRGGRYGDINGWYRKYELMNSLLITDSKNYPYVLDQKVAHDYLCSHQYSEGDVVQYSGYFWTALEDMPDPFDTTTSKILPHECTTVYYRDDTVCYNDEVWELKIAKTLNDVSVYDCTKQYTRGVIGFADTKVSYDGFVWTLTCDETESPEGTYAPNMWIVI